MAQQKLQRKNYVTEITSKEEFYQIIRAKGLTVTMFYIDGNQDCTKFTPKFQQLASDFNDKAAFYQANKTNLPELAQNEGITAVPTSLFYKDSERVDKYQGISKDVMEEKIKNHQ